MGISKKKFLLSKLRISVIRKFPKTWKIKTREHFIQKRKLLFYKDSYQNNFKENNLENETLLSNLFSQVLFS